MLGRLICPKAGVFALSISFRGGMGTSLSGMEEPFQEAEAML